MRRDKIKFIFALSGVLTVLLAVLYIFQLGSLTRTMYLIRDCSSKIEEISAENEMLEVKASQMSSLENLKPLVDGLNFEMAGKIDYIRVRGEAVVAVKP
ncbi:MAG: hypothetical protein DRI01_06825 [Chloroflexi bacterium]|nr:MAG: hypothetical protein DRI01_06825 [Chloroflexota bacterium]